MFKPLAPYLSRRYSNDLSCAFFSLFPPSTEEDEGSEAGFLMIC